MQDYVLFRRDADAVFTSSEKLWGANSPPAADSASTRARSIHDEERSIDRGRGVRVHHQIDEEKAEGIPSEAPEKTGYRQPGGNDQARLRSRSRGRGLRSVDEHREVSLFPSDQRPC